MSASPKVAVGRRASGARRCIAGMAMVASAVIAASCNDVTGPLPRSDVAPRLDIVDARNGGTAGFYFLPPLAPVIAYGGTFDPERSPVVTICRMIDSACGPVVATYSLGIGTSAIRVDSDAEQYVVQWHTKTADVRVGETYRIRVSEGRFERGHADIRIVSRASEAREIPGGFVPTVAGATVPIKFRLEVSTVPDPVSETIGTAGGTIQVPLADGAMLSFAVPAGALTQPISFTITPIEASPGSIVSALFSPANHVFEKPVTFTITPAVTIPSGDLNLVTVALGTPSDPASLLLPTTSSLSGGFVATTGIVGHPEPPVVSVVTQSLLRFNPASVEEDEQAQVDLAIADAQARIAAFRAAAEALATSLQFEDAAWYRNEAVVLMQLIGEPAVDNEIQQAQTNLCSAINFYFSTAEGRLGSEFRNLWNAIRPVLIWKAEGDLMSVTGDMCPATDTFSDVITELIDQFTELYTLAMNPSTFEDRVDDIQSELWDAFAARRYGALLDQQPAFDRLKAQIQLPLARQYRKAGYDWCRAEHEQKHLGSLFRIVRAREMYAPGAPEIARFHQVLAVPEDLGFNETDLFNDIQYCGNGIVVYTRDTDELSSRKGTVGGGEEPGSRVTELSFRIDPHGKIELDSVLTALVCANESIGNDRIYVEFNGQRIREIERIEPTVHFIRNNRRVFDVDSLAETGGVDLDEGGTFALALLRDSDGCAGEYSLPSEANPTVLATLNLQYPRISVTLDVDSVTLEPGQTRSFTATVTGTTNTDVTWEVTGGDWTEDGNSIQFTAGNTPGTYPVVARSVVDTARTDTVLVTIGDPCAAGAVNSIAGLRVMNASSVEECVEPTISVTPDSAFVAPGGTIQYAATISGTSDQSVAWSATGGTISNAGVYLAGPTPGSYVVTATSVADPGQRDSAVVTVVQPIPVRLTRRECSMTSEAEAVASNVAKGFSDFTYAAAFDPFNPTHTANLTADDGVRQANASVNGSVSGNVVGDEATGFVTETKTNGSADVNTSRVSDSQFAAEAKAATFFRCEFQFDPGDEEVFMSLSGSVSVTLSGEISMNNEGQAFVVVTSNNHTFQHYEAHSHTTDPGTKTVSTVLPLARDMVIAVGVSARNRCCQALTATMSGLATAGLNVVFFAAPP